jgi:hypothetical protein
MKVPGPPGEERLSPEEERMIDEVSDLGNVCHDSGNIRYDSGLYEKCRAHPVRRSCLQKRIG